MWNNPSDHPDHPGLPGSPGESGRRVALIGELIGSKISPVLDGTRPEDLRGEPIYVGLHPSPSRARNSQTIAAARRALAPRRVRRAQAPRRARLIGLTGRKRSGKDTVGAHLVEQGFWRVALADPIKQILVYLDPFVDGGTPDAGERAALSARLRIGFQRYTGAIVGVGDIERAMGTLAPHAAGSVRLSGLLRAADGDWDLLKDEDDPRHREIRRLQQVLGTEVGRMLLGERIWVDVAMRQATDAMNRGVSVVITDVRYDNEASAIRQAGGRIIGIARPSLGPPRDAHMSESGVASELVDYVVFNDASIEELHTRVDALLR